MTRKSYAACWQVNEKSERRRWQIFLFNGVAFGENFPQKPYTTERRISFEKRTAQIHMKPLDTVAKFI